MAAASAGAVPPRFVLPVAGIAVLLRQPTGAEDLLLAEHDADDPTLALKLVSRLADATPEVAWETLPISDIDALIARLRQAIIGDRVIADINCASPSCGQRVDLSFSLDAWLMHHRPRPNDARARGWRPVPDAAGWYESPTTSGEPVRFRLPTLADQIEIDGDPEPARTLARRCLRPDRPPGRVRARVEAAMEALAPPLAGPLQGQCPDCGTPIAARFEARQYCLLELRDRARFIYDDVDTLAGRYHWSEQAILTLPHARRARYAERARQAEAA